MALDIDLTADTTPRNRIALPEAWDDARPVLEGVLEQRRIDIARKSEENDKRERDMQSLRAHLDSRFDGLDRDIKEVTELQKDHGTRIKSVETDNRLLRDQQSSLIAATNSILQGFAKTLGHQADAIYKQSMMIAGGILIGVTCLLGIWYIGVLVSRVVR